AGPSRLYSPRFAQLTALPDGLDAGRPPLTDAERRRGVEAEIRVLPHGCGDGGHASIESMYPSVPAFDSRGFGAVREVDPAARGRLVRRSGGRVIGGVAGGIADHLRVDVFKVRVAFVLLSALAGAGTVAYGLL